MKMNMNIASLCWETVGFLIHLCPTFISFSFFCTVSFWSSLAYGGKILLHQTRMRLLRGHRYALVGQNGVGSKFFFLLYRLLILACNLDGLFFPLVNSDDQLYTLCLICDHFPFLSFLPSSFFIQKQH